jgi:hypothetical protein
MSSYELFVQEPIRPAEISFFHPFSSMKVPNLDNGVERSGVNGPLMVGSSSERFLGPAKSVYIRDANTRAEDVQSQ